MAQIFAGGATLERGTDDDIDRTVVLDALRTRLESPWWVFCDRILETRLGRGTIDFVLAHPRFGILLLTLDEPIDTASSAPSARAILGAFLEETGFFDTVGGPVAMRQIDITQIESEEALPSSLLATFGAGEPTAATDPDWVEALADLLARPDDHRPLATATTAKAVSDLAELAAPPPASRPAPATQQPQPAPQRTPQPTRAMTADLPIEPWPARPEIATRPSPTDRAPTDRLLPPLDPTERAILSVGHRTSPSRRGSSRRDRRPAPLTGLIASVACCAIVIWLLVDQRHLDKTIDQANAAYTAITAWFVDDPHAATHQIVELPAGELGSTTGTNSPSATVATVPPPSPLPSSPPQDASPQSSSSPLPVAPPPLAPPLLAPSGGAAPGTTASANVPPEQQTKSTPALGGPLPSSEPETAISPLTAQPAAGQAPPATSVASIPSRSDKTTAKPDRPVTAATEPQEAAIAAGSSVAPNKPPLRRKRPAPASQVSVETDPVPADQTHFLRAPPGTPDLDGHLAPPIDAADLPPPDSSASTIPSAVAPTVAPTAAPAPTTQSQGPAKPTLGRDAPGPSVAAARPRDGTCRPYEAPPGPPGTGPGVRGIACLQSDGPWHLVSQAPDR